MQIFKEIGALKAFLMRFRKPGSSIGLVPTMGALHDGHLSLISASKTANTVTVCTIFVNPAQFNNPADLEKYPRTPDKDQEALEKAGCDVLFIPEVAEMYNNSHLLRIEFGGLDTTLEGKFRPGHFSGVAVIVAKLFNIVLPTQVYFGQKDYQQYCIIALLVDQLKFDVVLHCLPTVREKDGLAMSSRNLRLSPTERQSAGIFYQCLLQAQRDLLSGTLWAEASRRVWNKIASVKNVRLEYFELVNQGDLQPAENLGDSILLIAGFVGEVRLIDNLKLS